MNEESWIQQFLQGLGLPQTTANTNWVSQWIAAEGPYGTQVNPINILGQGVAANDPLAAANWLKTNGNWGGIGTYAQNIQAYLSGQTNNLTQSLSWFSGHSGNPVSANDSTFYNNPGSGTLQAAQAFVAKQGTPDILGFGNVANAINPSIASGVQAVLNAPSALVSQIESTALVTIGAVTFIFIGGLWIIFGNNTTKQIMTKAATRMI